MMRPIPPHPDPLRIKVTESDSALRITLPAVPWRQAVGRCLFLVFFVFFGAGWTITVAMLTPETWRSTPVFGLLFLAVGALLTIAGVAELWNTVRSAFFSVSVQQTFDQLEIRRLGSRRRWRAVNVTAFDADQMTFYVYGRSELSRVSLPCRNLHELRWLAASLADQWSIPAREPLGPCGALVTVALIECRANDRAWIEDLLRRGTPRKYESSSTFSGRLRAETGRMALRNDDWRAIGFEFLFNKDLKERSWKLLNPTGPKAFIRRQDLIWFQRDDRKGLWIVCPPLFDSELVAFELLPDDPSALAVVLEVFCSVDRVAS